MWKFLSRATTRTVSSRPGSGMMGSAQTEHLGAYCLRGAMPVGVRMGRRALTYPKRKEMRRQTALYILPHKPRWRRLERKAEGWLPYLVLIGNVPPLPTPNTRTAAPAQSTPRGPQPGPPALANPPSCGRLGPVPGAGGSDTEGYGALETYTPLTLRGGGLSLQLSGPLAPSSEPCHWPQKEATL